MNTDHQQAPGKKVWLLPLVLALPFLAAAAVAVIRFGPDVMQLISAAVKTAVVP